MSRNPDDRTDALASELVEELVPDRPRPISRDYLGFAVPLRLTASALAQVRTLEH